MKTFKISYSGMIVGALYVLFAIGVAAVVVNILILASVGPFSNATPAVTVISLICSLALTSVAALILFRSGYRFADDGLKIIFGFLPVVIPYAAMLEIKEHTVTHEMFLLYRDTKSEIPDKINLVRVMVKPDTNDAFTAAVREKNREVIYSPFTPE